MTLLERLRKVEPEGGDENRTRWYRNPDGPEAAKEIERLNAAWNECSADKHRLLKEVRALDAEVARLQARERELEAALRGVVESAHTDADRCAICGEELHAHASGCSIAVALAAVSAETEGP